LDLNGLDVTNNSSGPVFVLAEEGGEVTCIGPGDSFPKRQDALAIPGTGSVFKTSDFVNATVDSKGGISLRTRATGSSSAGGGVVDAILMGKQAVSGGELTGDAVDEAGLAFQNLLTSANSAGATCGCPQN